VNQKVLSFDILNIIMEKYMKYILSKEEWTSIGVNAGWMKTALRAEDDGTDEKTPEQYKEEFIERMKNIGMTDEEIERALRSGYLERIMKGKKSKE
jgi:hypothetical protein